MLRNIDIQSIWIILEEEEVSNGDLLYIHLLFTQLFPLVE